ncbi:MAG: hypothetical protein ABSD92_13120 [Candidatus Bathyarchaeia archaeon]
MNKTFETVLAVDDVDNCRCSICHQKVKELIKFGEKYLCRNCYDDFRDYHVCGDLE